MKAELIHCPKCGTDLKVCLLLEPGTKKDNSGLVEKRELIAVLLNANEMDRKKFDTIVGWARKNIGYIYNGTNPVKPLLINTNLTVKQQDSLLKVLEGTK